MDGKKDDSERCISIALESISLGDTSKARRFLEKALRFYPTKRAQSLLDSLDNNTNGGVPNNAHGDGGPGENVRQRKHSHSRSPGGDEGDKQSKSEDYTQEQLRAVQRINKCKDVYEILEVPKDFKESDLKKAYRKLALQMHPDKNKAPGATEAFKAVGKAYGILSDNEKKRQYDLYGPDFQSSRSSHHHDDYSQGFEGDISPEELFNMFFGGGYPSGAAQRRHHHHHHHGRRTYYSYTRESPQSADSGLTLFFQLAPIILLVVLSMLSSFFVSDPVFSLQRNAKYNIERKTPQLKVPYFVKDDFRVEFKSDLRRIERAVEEEYIGQLRSNCFRERSNKESMMWRARNYGDKKLYERAMNMATPSCDNLQKVYGS